MNPPHRTHRPDSNRDEIVHALEQRGWTVFNTGMVGEGFSDLVVAKRFLPNFVGGEDWWVIRMVEIKNGSAGYTPKEQKFMDAHPGLVITVRSVEDVERLF
jgi:hypothetical protein